jgi:Virulence-associated protein and related proteins
MVYIGGSNMDKAKIFMNGRSQAVRLPKECRIEDKEVYIKKIGDIVILMPEASDWKVMESAAAYFTEDFMEDRKQPGQKKRSDCL